VRKIPPLYICETVVPRNKMKKTFITAFVLMVTITGFADEPFDRVDTNRIVCVVVGHTVDPFADKHKPTSPPKFQKYFELHDVQLAKTLAGLVKEMKKSDEMNYPFIGVLSEQQFIDSAGNVVFTTHIVNWKNSVVIDSIKGAEKDYFQSGRSEKFCRIIYQLMKKHCPKIIKKQEVLP